MEPATLTWRPNYKPREGVPGHGVQEFSLRVPPQVYEVVFGGARGGGKTVAGIYWLIKPINHPLYDITIKHPLYRALVLRRNSDDLSDWLDRADHVFREYGARLIRTPHPRFVFPSGAVIRCGHLKDKDAYTKYQGHEYQRVLIEELTQIAHEHHYNKVLGSCRSTIEGIPAQVFLTTNPGGRGHVWVRQRFVKSDDEVRKLPNIPFLNPATGRLAIYIPANVEDNPVLARADPEYVKWLDALKVKDVNLWKAWRLGDWDAFEGQVFSEWRERLHVTDRFAVNMKDCKRIAALDWGWNDPTSIHWLAQTPENRLGVRRIYVYRELRRNKLTPAQWADMLCTLFKHEPVDYLVLPHDCFSNQQGYQSVAQVFTQAFQKANVSVPIRRADSLARGNRILRVALMHQMLSIAPDGIPYMQVHPNCYSLISTLPELIYDEDHIEDVADGQDDHDYDSLSYGLMTITPNTQKAKLVYTTGAAEDKPSDIWQVTPEGRIRTDDILKSLAQKDISSIEPEV